MKPLLPPPYCVCFSFSCDWLYALCRRLISRLFLLWLRIENLGQERVVAAPRCFLVRTPPRLDRQPDLPGSPLVHTTRYTYLPTRDLSLSSSPSRSPLRRKHKSFPRVSPSIVVITTDCSLSPEQLLQEATSRVAVCQPIKKPPPPRLSELRRLHLGEGSQHYRTNPPSSLNPIPRHCSSHFLCQVGTFLLIPLPSHLDHHLLFANEDDDE